MLGLAGYWEQMLEGEEHLVIQGMVAEVERRHGVQVDEVAVSRRGMAAAGAARARAGPVLGPSPCVLEEQRDYTYMQNAFNVFIHVQRDGWRGGEHARG